MSPARRNESLNWIRALAAVALWIVVVIVSLAGCDQRSASPPRRHVVAPIEDRGGLFETVADTLDRLEQFDPARMLPLLCEWLNQWYQQEKPMVRWERNPLIAKLPEELRNMPDMKNLESVQFRTNDAWYLQETVWLRDVSNRIRGDQFDDVAVAQRLFDWTIRNIQLDPDPAPQSYRHRPYETMLLSSGPVLDRDWVFMLLARQQGLDVVLLGVTDETTSQPRPWLTALLSGGELYLFDARLGLPIPGANGRGVATLSAVKADEQLLRQLDLDEANPYPVNGSDLKRVVAWVEASPVGLTRRMALVESRLTGKHKMVLTSAGSDLVDRLKKTPHVSDAGLWPWPFEVWQARLKPSDAQLQVAAREMIVFQAIPALMTARGLYFKGNYEGDKGAIRILMAARPPKFAIENYRVTAAEAEKIGRENLSKVEAMQIVRMQQGKQNASFWLGLICYEQEDYPVAIDWFAQQTLAEAPNGPWATSARYNLARSYEANGDLDKAIRVYEADRSPQSHGNKLRARRLKETKPAASKAD